MNTFSYELREFSAESMFNWEIKNFNEIEWKKGYSVKSKEIEFKEANTSWFLTLKTRSRGINYYLMPFFHVRDNTDENSRFKFEILLNDDSAHYQSMFFNKCGMNIKDSYYEYQLPNSISMTDDSLKITAKVTFETLKYYSEESIKVGDDFDHLSDAGKSVVDGNEAPCCSKDCDEKNADISGSDSDESICCDTPNSVKKDMPISEMNDMDLSTFISRIYLGTMKQVAETSGSLLIAAAKNNYKELLTDCSTSLAAQMNKKNFMDIWDIAERLNIDELKKLVIKFVVSNRGNIRYDGRMSPDLLREVVKAMD